MADQLSIDSSAAIKLGMSYGKYIAMMQGKERQMPNPKPKQKPKSEPQGNRVCVVCGNAFVPKKHNQKCCCYDCSLKMERARMREITRKKRAERKAQNERSV